MDSPKSDAQWLSSMRLTLFESQDPYTQKQQWMKLMRQAESLEFHCVDLRRWIINGVQWAPNAVEFMQDLNTRTGTKMNRFHWDACVYRSMIELDRQDFWNPVLLTWIDQAPHSERNDWLDHWFSYSFNFAQISTFELFSSYFPEFTPTPPSTVYGLQLITYLAQRDPLDLHNALLKFDSLSSDRFSPLCWWEESCRQFLSRSDLSLKDSSLREIILNYPFDRSITIPQSTVDALKLMLYETPNHSLKPLFHSLFEKIELHSLVSQSSITIRSVVRI